MTTLTSFPARSDIGDEFSGKADRLYKLRRTRRSFSRLLRNANKGKRIIDGDFSSFSVMILKIDEVGELFEEARGTLNKNVVCAIKELHIYNAL
ncbi:hypothetical protein Bca4012_037290 [Brassica carinata]